MDDDERYIKHVLTIIKRLHSHSIFFSHMDRDKLADLLEELLYKWVNKDSGGDDAVAIISFGDTTTRTGLH